MPLEWRSPHGLPEASAYGSHTDSRLRDTYFCASSKVGTTNKHQRAQQEPSPVWKRFVIPLVGESLEVFESILRGPGGCAPGDGRLRRFRLFRQTFFLGFKGDAEQLDIDVVARGNQKQDQTGSSYQAET